MKESFKLAYDESNRMIRYLVSSNDVIESSDFVENVSNGMNVFGIKGMSKPIIGILAIPDQAFIMRRFEEFGVGKTLT
ncbi:MAG: hypothetical protein A2452_05625 [Candidatus Firestonebacteria bacterium RIFOXYC2_FULL_39_67]|nr:MAG: hypothetical protein A2536_10455 [Candidatus Firestonebacteria bacterium RIFOXYD2_FULL_39_29]OGF51801.1 MAG: hypothetical protein A2497_08065 [Candidatus Firestonebacteria bacterium RifOxyC12_full_39_7]OGF56418.1 MAG: hypothetical protein A2452_05625 [Candidatus Firestonebacteria bacterium RIFOXYC2_FULL_39_67]